MLFLYGMEYIDYKIPATYVGGSMQYDLAVLRVEDSDILKEALSRGAVAQVSVDNSEDIIVGQTAIAIGNPQAGGISATSGIVSVDSEYIDMTGADGTTPVSFRVVRVDTAINQGNSGGGLFNDKGELIGIVNAKIISSNVENIGYAIPSNVARAIADNIIYYCFEQECESVTRVLLGISVTQSALYTEYDEQTGVLRRYEEIKIHSVTGGALADGKILPDDIVKSITLKERTTEITRQHQVIDILLDARAGDKVTIVVKRANGEGTRDEIAIEMVITEDCLTLFP
jgi:serine protease Do